MIKAFLFLLSLWSCGLACKQITVLSSEGPPHTINNQFNNGIDLDIVRVVLERLGYEVKFHFVPLGRAESLVKSGQYAAMAPIFMAEDDVNFHVTHPIVQYKPTVFSLSAKAMKATNLAEIKGKSIITFQGAPGYFGAFFEKLSEQENYFEAPKMQVIPELLMKGRYDYAVLDKYIFYYFYRLNDKQRDVSYFKEHNLMAPVTASAVFTDNDLRDRFNRELVVFLLEGGYQKVLEKYLGKIEER